MSNGDPLKDLEMFSLKTERKRTEVLSPSDTLQMPLQRGLQLWLEMRRGFCPAMLSPPIRLLG